ncbi:YecA family protein [Fibrella aquatilis]|uniref:SEC-C domain-containing protein n=1 Tax=Fibrella aquatilis TaxID=2817059 RepID=A0A939JZW7_9BACT|nr:SEC-C domain-containing protein [Fibrella aquatilis]MBO0931853.1 SEC-C domain-containing protein [Fibrella aquatilis]
MHPSLHKDLERDINQLISFLATRSTRSIVSSCATMFYLDKDEEIDAKTLAAKVKQIPYLLGLMLTTTEPKHAVEFSQQDWRKAKKLLESIVFAYGKMFFPTKEEIGQLSSQWHKVREVAMPVFLQYFTAGLYASVEQVSNRIQHYLTPFDGQLLDAMGISATDVLAITKWVSAKLQTQTDELFESMRGVQQIHADFVKFMDENEGRLDIDDEVMRRRVQTPEATALVSAMQRGFNQYFSISLQGITEVFGLTKARAFWKAFVVKRGEAKGYFYLTERNPMEEKPLIELTPDVAMCPLANLLYIAVEQTGSRLLLDSQYKEAFLTRRDAVLEKEVEKSLVAFFTADTQVFSAVYETPTSHYEHDLILLWNKKLLIVEAKATPPAEPFRDPEKAYERVKRAFKSKTGIQKAYDQADRIRKQLAEGSRVPLYDKKGNLLLTLDPAHIDEQYAVCVTRDSYGIVATNLTLLLEKEEDAPYPWVTNIYDLDNLLDAWRYLGWGPDRLFDYIRQRIALSGKVFALDELEIAGFYIRHDSLTQIADSDYDIVTLNHLYSDVFDEIYIAKRTGETYTREVIDQPVYTNMKDMFDSFAQENERSNNAIKRRKQRPNDRCACNSGKKYKKCCGS